MSVQDSRASACQVIEQCLSGKVPEANGLQQMLHLYKKDSASVIGALSEKFNKVVENADMGTGAARAASLLVNITAFLEKAASDQVARQLLEHMLLLSGGKNRAAKDKAVRAQGCTILASLAALVPGHKAAEEKLLECALDKLPSIRERAVRGLGGLSGVEVERALMARTTDQCTAVRASAVRSLRLTAMTRPALLERIDDVEPCVRSQLFSRLAEEPAALDDLGPAALARLLGGLSDRSCLVRDAAGVAVDAWHEHVGGALALLGRCDLLGDEAIGEAAAAAVAARYPEEGAAVAKRVLGGSAAVASVTPSMALLARLATAAMSEAQRDENIDLLGVMKLIRSLLNGCQGLTSSQSDFLLRQFLHVLTIADVCCDEGLRRHAQETAEAVLERAPLTSAAPGKSAHHSSVDLGVIIIRKACGLGQRFQAQNTKLQALEARCSTRMVLLVSEICQPLTADKGKGGVNSDAEQFTTRLSDEIKVLNDAIEKEGLKHAALNKMKAAAVKLEDFVQAQELKEKLKKTEQVLAKLGRSCEQLKTQRDSVCHRVLSIISAVLRWSNGELRKDPALFGTLGSILQPVISLPALSPDVELAAVSAICLFCVRDGIVARGHWTLLLDLVRELRSEADEQRDLVRSRAAVAARTLVDCTRMHGGFFGALDKEEIIGAASGLSAVPFSSRHLVIEPLCSWMLHLGHIFFEDHLTEPVLDVQWGLGWLLVETFKQRPREAILDDGWRAEMKPPAAAKRRRGGSWVTRQADTDDEDAKPAKPTKPVRSDDSEDSMEAMILASRLMQFFALLPKLPGKHGAPLLSLAVEAVAESGLWRRAALMPQTMDGQTRWLRGFSWPELFAFAHARLPADMRFRLWRCALQLCVLDPELAPLAEVPIALASAAEDAPPGAAELVQEAIRLGADPSMLSQLGAKLPQLPEAVKGELLMSKEKASAAEAQRRAALKVLGIDIDDWAPADVEAPQMAPPHHRMRAGRAGPRNGRKAVVAVQPEPAVVHVPKEEPDTKRRRTINWEQKLGA